MENPIPVNEKYERNGWPSLPRPDLKPPHGWDISLISAQERIRNHNLSPDGTMIAFIKDTDSLSDVYIMPSKSGWPGRLTTDRKKANYWDDEIPQWAPEGSALAFTIDGQVHLTPAGGGLPEKISGILQSTWSPHWMPDAKALIVSAAVHEADQLLLVDRHGTWSRLLTMDSDGDHWDAQPAPDGKSIIFQYRRFDDLHRLDICLIDLLSGESRTIYGKPQIRTRHPRWSSDCNWVAFISQEAGHDDLWICHPDGTNLHQVTHLSYDILQFAWHPHEAQILCTVNRGGAIDLALLDVMDNTVTYLHSGTGIHSNPAWSPDGSFITFEYESPCDSPEIYRMDLSGKSTQQLTYSMLPALAATKMAYPEQISYRSMDGWEIPAFLFRPAKPNRAAIVLPHGGPSAQYRFEWDLQVQYFLAKGYTILAPNYRGSTGYGVEHEHANHNNWGGGDVQDCLFAARFLSDFPEIDPQKLSIMGGSYGGYLANCCLARDPDYLFACAVAKYGDANTLSSWALCKRELQLYAEIFLGHPSRHMDNYEASSLIHDVEHVRKPLLLLHGLDDEIVPPQASEEWAAALRANGKIFEYKTYAGEAHGFLLGKNIIDSLTRTERFLDWYLL